MNVLHSIHQLLEISELCKRSQTNDLFTVRLLFSLEIFSTCAHSKVNTSLQDLLYYASNFVKARELLPELI